MTYPTYNTPETEKLPTGTYLALFHGRKDPKQHMDDWGFDGPVIGPIKWAQTTYACEVKVCLNSSPNDREVSMIIPIVEGCAEFDGKFYGDWTVYQHTQRRVKDIPVDSDRRKS